MLYLCALKRGGIVFSCLLSRDKIILSEMHHSLTKWGWTQWMFLYFMVSGACSLVTVHQPAVLTAALGHNVIMPCQLKLSQDEKMGIPPVLYWTYLAQNTVKQLWIPDEHYKGRVDRLDNNESSSNKSILLKTVKWSDSGKYLCKLSVTTERNKSFRIKGNQTFLMVYDTMIFSPTTHNDSLLWCAVDVTRDPRLVLSIFHDGCKLQTVDTAPGDAATAAQAYVTLSETVSLRSGGKYECQLHLSKDLITKSIFHHRPPVAEEGGDAEKNVSATHSPTVSEQGVVVFPEPWLLYVALLLVPASTLLGLVTALLMQNLRLSSCGCNGEA